MAKFTPYAVAALPSTGIDVNGIYFKKAAGDSKFFISIRKNDNSDWVHLGTMNSVDEVNGLTGDVQIDLSFNTSTGVLSLTGSAATVDLDARYDKKSDNIAWSRISSKPTTLAGYGITDAALDADVVHKTGTESVGGVKTFTDKPIVPTPTATGEAANKGYVDGLDAANVKLTGAQTIAGVKTFSSSPIVPTPSGSTDAANKSYVDTGDAGLQSQINSINTALAEGMHTPTDIACNTNPNYPAATKGDTWIVTSAGKIGGASGIDVEVGDMIVCKTTNGGGTQAAVGTSFFIVQSNLVQATESIAGTAKLATTAQMTAGSDDTTIATPLKVQQKLNTERTTSDGKYVRVDTASQGLNSTQQGNARTNIGAAEDTAVVKLTGNQSVGGTKTFSTSPVVPSKSSAAANAPTAIATEAQVYVKANDADVVKLTGAQTVAGVKTFSSSPVVPTAAANDNSTKAASTAYVDAAVTAGVAWGEKAW